MGTIFIVGTIIKTGPDDLRTFFLFKKRNLGFEVNSPIGVECIRWSGSE